MKTRIQLYFEEMFAEESAKGSTGAVGKAFECALRNFSAGRKVSGIKEQGKRDAIFTFAVGEGKRSKVTVEIKTACGEIATLEGAQYVVYCPEVDMETEAEDQGYVFTLEEWHDFLNGYGGRGSLTRVNSRGELHIQSFRSEGRPKASKPLADYIWNCCYDKLTFREWVALMRNR